LTGMRIPEQPKIYHILHVDRLASVRVMKARILFVWKTAVIGKALILIEFLFEWKTAA